VSLIAARFFPVKAERLRMQPGLFRLGHDFGNGLDDTRHLLRDSNAAHYREAKSRVLDADPGRALLGTDDATSTLAVHRAISDWLRQTLLAEHAIDLPERALSSSALVREAYVELALELQEDFVVLQRAADGAERAALVCVCFPSAWRPERIAGQSFLDLHAPVPEFENVAARSAMLVSAMIERGPYLRFVWNVVADSRLDHHPDRSPRAPWTLEQPGFLRVERQLSVPFPAQQASLFLIRTYLYPLSELSVEERSTLSSALTLMSEPVQRYKGLTSALPQILARLA
jgi:dimethylamine monooxygenase subunit A